MWTTFSGLPNGSTVAQLRDLPMGQEVSTTLRIMADLARGGVRDPAQEVRETALSLVRDLPPRAWIAQIERLQEFVKGIRYVRDPVDLETVQTPMKTLEYGQGDCDDQATLLASLLTALGHPARFIAVAFKGGPFEHVLVQTKVNSTGQDSRDWVTAETIIDKPLGWFPAGVTNRYIRKV